MACATGEITPPAGSCDERMRIRANSLLCVANLWLVLLISRLVYRCLLYWVKQNLGIYDWSEAKE